MDTTASIGSDQQQRYPPCQTPLPWHVRLGMTGLITSMLLLAFVTAFADSNETLLGMLPWVSSGIYSALYLANVVWLIWAIARSVKMLKMRLQH